MGTIISLDLSSLELVSSKNSRGMDHGSLFQTADRKPYRTTTSVAPVYEEEEPLGDSDMAFVRTLRDVLPRLELLGYTLANAKAAYDRWVATWREDREALRDDLDLPEVIPLTFEEFRTFVVRHAVTDLDDTYHEYGTDQARVKGRFTDEAALIARIPIDSDHSDLFWSERSYFAGLIGILDPYLILRLLAENPANSETEVIWQYGPLVENGWAKTEEFSPLARRAETFLVATEGSSDAHILKHALELLRPEIRDFFRFIDVTERHPFAGTGNLVKFAEGLAKIDVHNQTLFVFDNDAEGVEAFQRVSGLALPPNMRAMLLPDLEAFRAFPTRGPEGDGLSDINGRGAAIECYLDHRLRAFAPPRVVWTNFKESLGVYHGMLEHKETYGRAFIKLKADDLSEYDTTKLEMVLAALVAECVAMASGDLAERYGFSAPATVQSRDATAPVAADLR